MGCKAYTNFRFNYKIRYIIFIRPSSDGTYYGMVMSVRPSVWVSVRPFSALFSYMLWHIELKFCTWLCSNVLQIKFECRQFASSFVGVMPLLELILLEIHSFPHFSLTCLWHIELKFCTWLCSNVHVLQIKFECRQFASSFVGVMPLLELKLLEIHSFPHFSLTCCDILSWNCAYDFVLLYYRSSSSVVNLRQFLWELCPFWNLNYWKYSFPHFCLTCFDILSWNFAYDFVLLYYRSSWSCVNFCGSYAPFGT